MVLWVYSVFERAISVAFAQAIYSVPVPVCSALPAVFKQGAENQAGERSAVEHLPEKCHRQVAAKGVRPCAEAGLLEQQGSDETHDRAHDADDHQGNRVGLLKYTA